MKRYYFSIDKERNIHEFLIKSPDFKSFFELEFPDVKSASIWFYNRINTEALYLRNAIDVLRDNSSKAKDLQKTIVPKMESNYDNIVFLKLSKLCSLKLSQGTADSQFVLKDLSHEIFHPAEATKVAILSCELLGWHREYRLQPISRPLEAVSSRMNDCKQHEIETTLQLDPDEALLYNVAKLNPMFNEIEDLQQFAKDKIPEKFDLSDAIGRCLLSGHHNVI